MNILNYILLFALVLQSCILMAQPERSDETRPTYSAPSFLGITILGNPGISLNSVSNYQNGVSVDHNTLQLSVSIGLQWAIQVRAVDDLRYQNYSIPVSQISMRAISLGNSSEIFLTTTNQTLASGTASSLLSAVMAIRYHALGGNSFLKPAGNYTTTLVFTYTAL